MTIFSVTCLVLFVNLGNWQLNREQEKRELIADREAKISLVPLRANRLEGVGGYGLPVKLVGKFVPEYTLLLDNVVFNSSVGFEVLQVFEDVSGLYLLVNRGFVPMGRTRSDPVEIPGTAAGTLQIEGITYSGRGNPLILGDSAELRDFPAIVQRVDIEQISRTTGLKLYDFVIRLDDDQPGALPRYWPDTVMPPEKHRGYAIQWFMMALAVVVAWIFFSFPRATGENNQAKEER